MQAYVEGIYELFSEHISEIFTPKTPFPPGCMLYKEDCPSDEEAQDILENQKVNTEPLLAKYCGYAAGYTLNAPMAAANLARSSRVLL